MVRFDDRLDSVLRIDPANDTGRSAIWRQLVDMLAQDGGVLSEAASFRALTALSVLRDSVPINARLASVRAIACRCRFAPLVTFLASDRPAIALEVLGNAQLTDADWLTVLPDIGPLGRRRLRDRDDLSLPVRRSLSSFGSTDFALPPNTSHHESVPIALQSVNDETIQQVVPLAPAVSSHEIADLVRRIEAYRSRQADSPSRPAAGTILFRTDADGLVRSASGITRGTVIGMTLIEPAVPGEPGFDAGVARAFGKRAPVRRGRLWFGGDDHNSAHWLIDADPQFDRVSGRFLGYYGTMQPASEAGVMADADIGPDHAQPDDPGGNNETHLVAEGMRQMVHELRSPVNAINGFAQLIDGQYFGPVGSQYRNLAQAIMADSALLVTAIEDIDIAARLDTGGIGVVEGNSDLADVIASIIADQAKRDGAGHPTIIVSGLETPAPIPLPDGEARRIVSRLFTNMLQHFSGEAQVAATLRRRDDMGMFELVIEKPADRGPVGSNDDAANTTVWGASFAFQLVSELARLYGGDLRDENNQFILNLPALLWPSDRIGCNA